jgi:hypothetical protein
VLIIVLAVIVVTVVVEMVSRQILFQYIQILTDINKNQWILMNTRSSRLYLIVYSGLFHFPLLEDFTLTKKKTETSNYSTFALNVGRKKLLASFWEGGRGRYKFSNT